LVYGDSHRLATVPNIVRSSTVTRASRPGFSERFTTTTGRGAMGHSAEIVRTAKCKYMLTDYRAVEAARELLPSPLFPFDPTDGRRRSTVRYCLNN